MMYEEVNLYCYMFVLVKLAYPCVCGLWFVVSTYNDRVGSHE